MKMTHMERKRSDLVPIGKAFGDLGGPGIVRLGPT